MVLSLVPDEIFGQDADDLLAYQTPKVAHIRDRHVGAAYYCLVSLALCWVIFGQILWRNEHFLLKDVKGIARMWITHPTRNWCDANDAHCLSTYRPMTELPYCAEYHGDSKADVSTACIYGDKHSLFPDGSLGDSLFIPTAVMEIEEEKKCNPNPGNAFNCDNEYSKVTKFDTVDAHGSPSYWNETNMKFYADIENYRIQFTSTYERSGVEGTSLEHPGFYDKCFDEVGPSEKLTWDMRMNSKGGCSDLRREPLKCLPGVKCNKRGVKTFRDLKLPDTVEKLNPLSAMQLSGAGSSGRALRTLRQQRDRDRRKEQDETVPDVFASAYGDTFSVGKLLELAGVDLDKHFSVQNEPVRMAGTILQVQIQYNNMQKFLSSFGLSQVQYSYRVKERKLPYVSREILPPGQPDTYPARRRYWLQHGLIVNFTVQGQFGEFNIVYLLIMLTTALALLGTAHKVCDIWAMYIHPRKRNYFHLKYDVSPDFSDMWECAKCGYFNASTDESCGGLEKYECELDHGVCGCTEATPKTQKFKKKSTITFH